MQTVLAFDFGEKRIGVAIGNTMLGQAQGLKTIQHKNSDETFRLIQGLVDVWQATQLVVGLPRHPDGNPHQMTKKATRFGNQLHGRLNLPVAWVDERYTSATALDPKGDLDSQSAVMILEQYFTENSFK